MTPKAVSLQIVPSQRFEITDVVPLLGHPPHGSLTTYKKVLYCSMHTTAGFVDPDMASKLEHRQESLEAVIHSARRLFPSGAPYWHDQMNLRSELSDEQKLREPHNADSHLVFISMGLASAAEYDNCAGRPVYFVDLDGKGEAFQRQRRFVVVGYNTHECVYTREVEIAMPDKPVVSVNLAQQVFGPDFDLDTLLQQHKIMYGAVVLALADDEEHAGLTVNEFEPLLIENDLAGVLDNPLHYMKKEAAGIVKDPRSLPKRAKKYLAQDLIQIINEIVATVGRHTSILHRVIEQLGKSIPYLERVIEYVATTSTSRWMGLNRHISLLISSDQEGTPGKLVMGTYQSPILVQWRRPASRSRRRVIVRLLRFQ